MLLRLANIISPPSYLWDDRALGGNDMIPWLVSSSLLQFHAASQVLHRTLDVKVAILLLCRKSNRYSYTLYILLDYRLEKPKTLLGFWASSVYDK